MIAHNEINVQGAIEGSGGGGGGVANKTDIFSLK